MEQLFAVEYDIVSVNIDDILVVFIFPLLFHELLLQLLLTREQTHLLEPLLRPLSLVARTNRDKLDSFFVWLVPPLTVFCIANQSDFLVVTH